MGNELSCSEGQRICGADDFMSCLESRSGQMPGMSLRFAERQKGQGGSGGDGLLSGVHSGGEERVFMSAFSPAQKQADHVRQAPAAVNFAQQQASDQPQSAPVTREAPPRISAHRMLQKNDQDGSGHTTPRTPTKTPRYALPEARICRGLLCLFLDSAPLPFPLLSQRLGMMCKFVCLAAVCRSFSPEFDGMLTVCRAPLLCTTRYPQSFVGFRKYLFSISF